MEEKQQERERLETLAKDVLKLSRNTLLVKLRFLDMALSRFRLCPVKKGFYTDGDSLYYDPVLVLKRYKEEKEALTRDYLHMVLHCVFHHLFLHSFVDPLCWDLACDISVENTICELGLDCTAAKRQKKQEKLLKELKEKAGHLTAEKLYHYFRENKTSEKELLKLRALFKGDDHELWYTLSKEEEAEQTALNEGAEQEKAEAAEEETAFSEEGPLPEKRRYGKDAYEPKEEEDGDEGGEAEGEGEDYYDPNGAAMDTALKKSLKKKKKKGKDRVFTFVEQEEEQTETAHSKTEEFWKKTAQRMQTDLETFSRRQGNEAGSMVQNLKAVTREKYDYADFLKRFAVMGENMKVNDDEFDYIFYSYGMQLYGKMPLVEPLEYKEDKRIKEFVIAIDTSGSVSGELVQKFVQKTYNILKQQESFFTKINLHIIQCDSEIQEDKKITCEKEFDEYLEHMELKGFGGTDFCPVFAYVDELRRKKEFTNLKGLIYFTDGYGDFPAVQPAYASAFVFLNDEYSSPEVPVWAIKLVLQSDEI